MDGENLLYLDRNGNGNLTDPEDRIELDVEATKKFASLATAVTPASTSLKSARLPAKSSASNSGSANVTMYPRTIGSARSCASAS
jgi:hypothetical protein